MGQPGDEKAPERPESCLTEPKGAERKQMERKGDKIAHVSFFKHQHTCCTPAPAIALGCLLPSSAVVAVLDGFAQDLGVCRLAQNKSIVWKANAQSN